MNINDEKHTVEQNQIRFSQENNRRDVLSELPSVLDAIIRDWGRELSKKLNRPINVWKELSILTGRAPSTLRSYCDEFNPVYPPIDVLLSICKATGKAEPLELINDFKRIHFSKSDE